MSTVELISLGIAMGGLVLSTIALVFNGIQTRRSAKFLRLNIVQAEKTAEHLVLDQQLARGNAVMHFTSRFFDLLKEGEGKELTEKIKYPNWAYQYWSLHGTEFFFFQNGILPTFMYTLWMIDLGKLYSGSNGEEVYKSHRDYLLTYSFNYPDMIEFFNRIHDFAKEHTDEKQRNNQIWNHVETWIKHHKKPL
jgi:hypothetical protein